MRCAKGLSRASSSSTPSCRLTNSGRALDVEGHTAKLPGNQPLLDEELSSDRA
ncbi:hypothetical protein IWX65_002042 [Arthrobacter sp. CAN_A214]|uniref:hypothetical protein n=1 Tax=Arthrobacter sp. CAN_A214 TaxID=2787720 RepID=UPI0018CB5375